ncbi:HugZ family pyridoxamine 5'-phosphate oxidase [Methylomonas fluvii]|uniref:Pyridoxamine 5'-phosphate oxidase family protein n=1 Tax=Methylomonas fluvii TaxID=1854564 RepID=A0ABR9DAP9_9GAMM|nr:pyridoxamine 5'-phosphate oxidase family protein [Methylomonas fluvii]MBD9360164.1 pyridoxamine 5'-phosphate oxidase family protein [Methylomonas fluvii]CAD6872955.1 Pyridoxamine 5'-phosphate oxidase-related putative heme iron utilization protein [Methylomonas fluvii]
MSSEPLTADYRTLITNSQSLIIASSSEQGTAEVSYAPFLEYQNTYYIYVSQLARHTGNMLRQRQASIMFIEPEAEAVNPFARRRLVIDCAVGEIDKLQAEYAQLLDRLQDRFGETVSVLRSLTDFHLLALTPLRGQYVAGFGKAFSIDVENGVLLPANH